MANTNNIQDLNLIKEAIVRLLDGTYKGPIPFGVDSKHVNHNGYTLEELLGYGLNPNVDGNITEQLASLRSGMSDVLLEQLQNAGIGKLYTTEDYIGDKAQKIYAKIVHSNNTDGSENKIPEAQGAKNNTNDIYANITITDPWGEIEILDLISSDITGNLFLITSVEDNTNKDIDAELVLRVMFITTVVTSILGRFENPEDHTIPLDSVKRSGNVKLSKYDVDLDKLQNKLYLPLVGAGRRLEGDLTIGKKKEGSSDYDYLYSEEQDYGTEEEEFSGNLVVEGDLYIDENTYIKGDLVVEGKSITLDSETLKVRDNLIETNVGNDYLFSYSGLAINTGDKDEEENAFAYGIVYDPIEDTVKLGLGKINQEGVFNFEYDEEGNTQGLSVVVRDEDLKDGVLLKWDEEHHKIVSIKSDDITADMIYFRNDITLAGSYTQVGNITKDNVNTSVENGLKAKGRTVEQILTEIFTKVLQPTNITQPKINEFTISPSGTVEAGTKYNSISFGGAILYPGSYQYGPATGIVAKSWKVDRICVPSSLSQEAIATTTSGSDNNNGDGFIIGDKGGENVVSSIQYKITAEYDEGVEAWNNIGGISDPVQRIQEGSVSQTTSSITSFRKYFYGYPSDEAPSGIDISSNFIREKLISGGKPSSGTKIINLIAGAKGLYIACPNEGSNKISVTKISNDTINQEVTADFKTQIVEVEGANNYTAINYKVWYYIPTNTYVNDTQYTITLG